MAAVPPQEDQGTFSDNYTIIGDPIAAGAFGAVFLCRPKQDADNVAPLCVKVLKKIENPETDGDIRLMKYYERELKNADKIHNEAPRRPEAKYLTVPFDTFRAEGTIHAVMEYVEGGTMTAAIQKMDKDGLPIAIRERIARRWTNQMLIGLQFLQSCGITHNDLKPDNVMLTSKDYWTSEVRIVDFGFSKDIGENDVESTVGGGAGSPAYQPPERRKREGAKVEGRNSFLSDVWAVGCITFEIITGKRAYMHFPQNWADSRIDTCTSTWPPMSAEARRFILATRVYKIGNPPTAEGRMNVRQALCHEWIKPYRFFVRSSIDTVAVAVKCKMLSPCKVLLSRPLPSGPSAAVVKPESPKAGDEKAPSTEPSSPTVPAAATADGLQIGIEEALDVELQEVYQASCEWDQGEDINSVAGSSNLHMDPNSISNSNNNNSVMSSNVTNRMRSDPNAARRSQTEPCNCIGKDLQLHQPGCKNYDEKQTQKSSPESVRLEEPKLEPFQRVDPVVDCPLMCPGRPYNVHRPSCPKYIKPKLAKPPETADTEAAATAAGAAAPPAPGA